MIDLAVFADEAQDAIPITQITVDGYNEWLGLAAPFQREWLGSIGFAAGPGKIALLPSEDGRLERVLLTMAKTPGRWGWASVPESLPPGTYRLGGLRDGEADYAALGWALAGYRFDRYKEVTSPKARLLWPEGADRAAVTAAAEAVALARDLVNTPANDMGPAEIAEAAMQVAAQFGVTVAVVEGEALELGYPAVHAVGIGSPRKPRLIDFSWGDPGHPKVTLVGKGVAFDTGGLDLKPADAMLTMKKDMGGAAHALSLAHMVMSLGLPLRLRVLIPAVENSTSGRAMRPLDVIRTRGGLTVEVGNTDAEGRLILADALSEAFAEDPALVLDFATLTGAARQALGPEIPPFFCNDEATAEALTAASARVHDPLWRLPLYQPYAADLEGKTADLNNIAGNSFAGAIYAALFLERFVPAAGKWAHFDVYAWNAKPRPGRPEGGEAYALHACLEVLKGIAFAA